MLKKIYLLFILLIATTLSGCGSDNTNSSQILIPHWKTQIIKTTERKMLEILYRPNIYSEFTQYAVLHLESSYFRMNYNNKSEWSTSIILFPTFWKYENNISVYMHSAEISDYKVKSTYIDNIEKLKIMIEGNRGGLYFKGHVIINPPTIDSITAEVEMNTENKDNITLGYTHYPQEELFKPVMLSSMHVSANKWDTNLVFVDKKTFNIQDVIDNANGNGTLILNPAIIGKSFGLEGGISDWQIENKGPGIQAVSVKIDLNKSLFVTGWIDLLKTDPNEDNLSFWAGTNYIIPNISYKITTAKTMAPENPKQQETLKNYTKLNSNWGHN